MLEYNVLVVFTSCFKEMREKKNTNSSRPIFGNDYGVEDR